MIHFFITGPIRPSENTVIDVITKMKEQIPNSKIHLSTWKCDIDLSKKVDTVIMLDPLSEESIERAVTVRNKEYRDHMKNGRKDLADMRLHNTFRMFYGVNAALNSVQCEPDDIVIRMRTDCVFLFEPAYLNALIELAKNSYIVRFRKSSGCNFDDWFALTTYKTLKRVWYMTSNEYNYYYANSSNAEDIVRRRVERCADVRVIKLDESRIEAFLYREDNLKRFYLD